MQGLRRRTRLAGLVLSLCAAPVFGHTTLVATSPKDGAVLSESPPVVELRFRAPVSLTAVTVLEAGAVRRKLAFAPQGSATLFKVADPMLAAGRNQIQWKALSQDGHVIAGSFSIEIRAAAANDH